MWGMLSFTPAMNVWYVVWHLHWADIIEGSQVRRWIEQREKEKQFLSDHKCWVLTLNHLSDANQQMEEDVSKHAPLHTDLLKTLMQWDAEAFELAHFRANFSNHVRFQENKELLVSFSTGFTSTRDDSVNAERAAEVGIEMEINLDGQWVTSTIWMSSQRQKPCHH